MEDTPLPIVADDRESRSAVVALLQSHPRVELHTQRLSLGDYLIDDWLLVERKTLPDLVASVLDGRLFSQALRLVDSGLPRTALVLEGTAVALGSGGRPSRAPCYTSACFLACRCCAAARRRRR